MTFCLHIWPIFAILHPHFHKINIGLGDSRGLPHLGFLLIFGQDRTKIGQNSRQNFILRGRFPLQSCRSRRDLQLCIRNLGLKMEFCLDFHPFLLDRVQVHLEPVMLECLLGRDPRLGLVGHHLQDQILGLR